MKQWPADLALLANTVIWGCTFVVVKEALNDVSPLLFLALRFGLALAVLLVLFRKHLGRTGLARALHGGVLCGVFLFTGYAFQTIGLRFTSAPKSAFITGLSTALVPLFGAFVYKIRPRALELGGVALAITGMGLMTLQGATRLMGQGDLLTLVCAVAFAGHILTVGHYSDELGFELLSVLQVGVSAVLALGLFWWAETPRVAWRPEVWIAVGVTGILATALAFTVQAWAQRYTSSTRTALIFTLEPIFAWTTSYVLTGETLSGRGITGALLILGGVLLVEMKPSSTESNPSR